MLPIQGRILKVHSVKVLKALISDAGRPNTIEFKLAHYHNIREKQEFIINQLVQDKVIRCRPVGKSRVRRCIVFN